IGEAGALHQLVEADRAEKSDYSSRQDRRDEPTDRDDDNEAEDARDRAQDHRERIAERSDQRLGEGRTGRNWNGLNRRLSRCLEQQHGHPRFEVICLYSATPSWLLRFTRPAWSTFRLAKSLSPPLLALCRPGADRAHRAGRHPAG